MSIKTPIIPNLGVDLDRYTSGLKKDQDYKDAVDATLESISRTFNIPFHQLHNGLFFKPGNRAKGILTLSSKMADVSGLDSLRKALNGESE